jgi:hypothetical protein
MSGWTIFQTRRPEADHTQSEPRLGPLLLLLSLLSTSRPVANRWWSGPWIRPGVGLTKVSTGVHLQRRLLPGPYGPSAIRLAALQPAARSTDCTLHYLSECVARFCAKHGQFQPRDAAIMEHFQGAIPRTSVTVATQNERSLGLATGLPARPQRGRQTANSDEIFRFRQ